MSFCVLAMDEGFGCDVALQIHFTLIQSFCFDNDISIVRVSDVQRLAAILGGVKEEQLEDAHCVLITVRGGAGGGLGGMLGFYCEKTDPVLLVSEQNPADGPWQDPALDKLHLFCEESRRLNDWLPEVILPAR